MLSSDAIELAIEGFRLFVLNGLRVLSAKLVPEFKLGPGEALGLVSCRRIEVCLDGGRGSGFKPLLICSRC